MKESYMHKPHMKELDADSWERRILWNKYKTYTFPYINIGAEVDVTGLYRFCKDTHLSFFCAVMHLALTCAHEIRNFGYRIVDDKPVLCERMDASFTYLLEDQEDFYVLIEPYAEDMLTFSKSAHAHALEKGMSETRFLRPAGGRQDIIYFTCIPWISYSHFIRTFESGSRDTVPRISWGKYYDDNNGRKKMMLSVQVHHALVDGFHVGKFYDLLQKQFDQFA